MLKIWKWLMAPFGARVCGQCKGGGRVCVRHRRPWSAEAVKPGFCDCAGPGVRCPECRPVRATAGARA